MKDCLALDYYMWAKGYENAAFYKNLCSVYDRLNRSIELLMTMIEPKCTYLDVGTNTGILPVLVAMNTTYATAKGIDLQISTAERVWMFLSDDIKKRVSFQTQDLYTLDPVDKYDYVSCTEVLEHLDDDVKAFDCIFESANKGILLTVPNDVSGQFVGHKRVYTKDDLANLIKTKTDKFEILDSTPRTDHFNFAIIKKGA